MRYYKNCVSACESALLFEVSVPTMHRAVQHLRLRRKKILYASEQDTLPIQYSSVSIEGQN